MTLDNIIKNAVTSIQNATFDYQPNIDTLKQNKTKTIIGAAVLLGLYILPGEQTFLSYATTIYTSLKGYQSVRDWMG